MIVLASASPRRAALLTQAGLAFEVRPAEIDEQSREAEKPEELALRLAREKALAVRGRLEASDARLVLGADTIVVIGDRVLGKPRDEAHAVELLSSLLGRTHRVLTAVAIVTKSGRAYTTVVESRVSMRRAPRAEVEAYASGGEPLDKAGAYALQGEGARFVDGVEGSRSNVIGLPLDETRALIARAEAAR